MIPDTINPSISSLNALNQPIMVLWYLELTRNQLSQDTSKQDTGCLNGSLYNDPSKIILNDWQHGYISISDISSHDITHQVENPPSQKIVRYGKGFIVQPVFISFQILTLHS